MVVQAQDRLDASADAARKPAPDASTTTEGGPEKKRLLERPPGRAPNPADAVPAVNALPAAGDPVRPEPVTTTDPAAAAAATGEAAAGGTLPYGLPGTPGGRSADRMTATPGPAVGAGADANAEPAVDSAATASATATVTDDPAAAAAQSTQADEATRAGPRPAAASAANPAIQLAMQQALREAGADPSAAAFRSAANRSLADISGHRGLRSRLAGDADQPDGRMTALAADRSGAASAANQGAAAPLTAGDADLASLIEQISAQATTASVMPTSASSADASVFALTMNQTAPSGLAATRSDMLAEMTQASIEIPIDHADFAEAFARQSATLIVQGSSSAEIHLNPRDMGPIRIAISLDADAASLDITAAHADTRAAIEASLPALRQMLGDQGLRLANWRLDGESAGDGLAQSDSQLAGQSSDAQQQRGNDANARGSIAGTAAQLEAAGNGSNGGNGGGENRVRPFSSHRPAANQQSAASPAGLSDSRAPDGARRIDLYA